MAFIFLLRILFILYELGYKNSIEKLGGICMKKIVIYTSDNCQFCHMAKDWLKENNFEFEEKNISEDKEAMLDLRKQGFAGVPVIFVDDEVILGFNQEKLEKALGL